MASQGEGDVQVKRVGAGQNRTPVARWEIVFGWIDLKAGWIDLKALIRRFCPMQDLAV
eukprot:CAMPEP_0202078488 /NCGR_PEP_ID=MMETSP0964-20121228/5964_1 /ASSEMBLY_ACC=CAM_ASM_000500 /TAXON_ID=4773 /ORGANISM="Schizochytrium aggregatum, Strain ATCC28209" /LENGTH=57 /DNA_ID=CAMNT_0048645797 /DNA_START=387 /DNA_END=560 /DNA_ORIENTATION=+